MMRDSDLVSVLVPIFNVENYLVRCVESVLAQDFPNWELILVDDGSPDNCPQIVDQYATKDSRIIAIHKKNGGLPSARLAGFQTARGKYVVFLDSDDWLFPCALSKLYTKIKEGYDLVRGGYRMVKSINEYSDYTSTILGEINGVSTYRKGILSGKIDPFMWGSIVRKECYTEECFKPVFGMSVGEDLMTNYRASRNIERVFIMPDILYGYYMNWNSIMHQKVASHVYLDKMFKILESALTQEETEDIYILKCYEHAQHINYSFYKEVGFDNDIYQRYTTFVRKHGSQGVKLFLDRSFFLVGINCKLFHRLFTKLYGVLLFYHRWKGHIRKLLY